MAQNQYYDIKPKLWDGDVLFNDLINVVPVPAPRTWMWTRKDDIVKFSDNWYYFFRKRRWINTIKTYRKNWTTEDTNESWRENWEFTDMVIWNWRRFFLRRNNAWSLVRVYAQVWVSWSWQLCDDDISAWRIVNVSLNDENAEDYEDLLADDWKSFIVAQDTYPRFLKTQWMTWLIDNDIDTTLYSIQQISEWWASTPVNYWVIDLPWSNWKASYVYIKNKWIVASVWMKVCDDVASAMWLEVSDDHEYYFVLSDNMLASFPIVSDYCEEYRNWASWLLLDQTIPYEVSVMASSSYWDTLSFCTARWIVQISEYVAKFENKNYRDSYINITWETLVEWSTITSATMWNNRIVFLTKAWWLFIWWSWYNQLNFVTWPATTDWDQIHWIYNVWKRFTTVMPEYYALVLAWPHDMAYFMPNTEWWYQERWLYEISDKVWLFNETAYCHKDWKLFMWRSYKDIYYFEMSSNKYWMQAWNFTYYSQDRCTRLKDLNQWIQKMNIDMTDNEMFVSIHEPANKYWSIVLCEDRHYNVRYTWLFENIKISRVLDWWEILLWDRIYKYWFDYDVKDDEQYEITEVIDIIFWDETPTANKMFMFYKLAIWDNSFISDNTWLTTNVTSSWRLRDRNIHLTTTRYVSMLNNKESEDKIREWDFWYEILWHWKREYSWFQRELRKYAEIMDIQKYNPRKSNSLASWLWLYSVLKENIWQEWELLQITLISWWVDNVEVWSCFIWRYPKDFDYADIEDVIVDKSELTSNSETEWHINVENN